MATRRQSHRIGPAPSRSVAPHRFPTPGEFMIYSTPVFLVTRDGQEELITFDAEMHVRAAGSRKTEAGPRTVEIDMLAWEAVGTSRLLGGEVRYRLLKGTESYVTGVTAAADLPGRMDLSGEFELLLNGEKVHEHRGSARGLVSAFPPAESDLFDISGSEVTLGNVRIRGVFCKCSSS